MLLLLLLDLLVLQLLLPRLSTSENLSNTFFTYYLPRRRYFPLPCVCLAFLVLFTRRISDMTKHGDQHFQQDQTQQFPRITVLVVVVVVAARVVAIGAIRLAAAAAAIGAK